MKRNLRDHASSQCHVIIEDNEIRFISYTTEVIRILFDRGRRLIECSGTYSPTTRRQIGWFLKEYASDLCYYDMKAIAGEGMIEF